MTLQDVWKDMTGDVRAVLADRERRWLHAAVLCAFALLPYNVFGLTLPRALPVFGESVKFTEIAFLLVAIAAIHALLARRLRILRAPVLYTFLALNAVAQFTALPIAGDRALLFDVGIAVARYSVLVALLVNVLRSDRLLRAVLMVCAGTTIVFGAMTYFRYLRAGGALDPPDIAAVLGSPVPHVLAYASILFGSGIIFVVVRRRYPLVVTGVLLVLFALLAQLLFIAYVKVGQIVFAIFLLALFAVLHGARRRAAMLIAIFALVFFYRYHIVDIRNAVHAWVTESRARIAALRSGPTPTRSPFPVDGDAVARGVAGPLTWFAPGARVVADAGATPQQRDRVPSAAPESASSVAGFTADATPQQRNPVPSTAPKSAPSVAGSTPAPTAHAPPAPASAVSTVPVAAAASTVAPAVDFYSAENRARINWTAGRAGDSVSVRQRGLAVGWLIGRAYPWTGIGPGQLRDKTIFDAFAEQVRVEARTDSSFPWKRYFFRDEVILADPSDKGIFNIFVNAWAETGVPGLLELLGLLGVVTVQSIRGIVWAWRRRIVAPISVCFPLFLALVLYHQTIYLWVHPWFWTMLALTYAAARVVHDEKISRN